MKTPLYVTCCAAAKDPAEGLLPAAWRYRSARIEAVLALAVARGAEFRILSGRFGLVAAGQPIPDYDQPLTAAAAPLLAEAVAARLREIGPGRVVLFTRTDGDDPGAGPYRACCLAACDRAGLPCRVVELPAGPVDVAMLELMG